MPKHRPLWLLLIILLAFSALAGAPRASSASDDAPPQVLETIPARGAELPIDGTIIFYFDQAMDRASVENAFAVEPVVAGLFTWQDDQTATFKATAPLQRNAEYEFSIGETARSASGVTIRSGFSMRMNTPSALEVVQILPATDSAEIEATPTITVIFNRPVVPLLSIDEMAKLPSPIMIEPVADGKGEWLSTSIYVFKPTQLVGGTEYKVTVKAGLKDITGSELEKDVVTRFNTAFPRVIDLSINDNATGVMLDAPLAVVFSQPMDRASTENAFSMRTGATAVTGTFTWNDTNTRMTFKPDPRLDYNKNYVVIVDRNVAKGANGGQMREGATLSFRTIPEPELVSTSPEDGERETRDSGFRMRFSAPMNLKDFKQRITVEPKPGLVFDDYSDDDGFFYNVGFSHEPGVNYTVSIDIANFVDKYGTPLRVKNNSNVYRVENGKLVIRWSVADYLPEISLRTGYSRIGLYSGYNASTRVFSTHRNLNRIDLELSSMSMDELIRLIPQPYDDIRADQLTRLRQWAVKVENPKNILRYDMLTITDQGPNVAPEPFVCDGAPTTRLDVGQEIVVLPDDPTPLRIRSQAGTAGRIVTQVPTNTRLRVLAGPICRDKYVWWQVQTLSGQRFTGWVAEGTMEGYFVGLPGMTSKVEPRPSGLGQPLDPQVQAGPLKPGVYVLRYSSPDVPRSRSDAYAQHIMVVATMNITVKQSENMVMAWVTDLQTGKPVEGKALTIYRVYGQTSGNGYDVRPAGEIVTDASGIARLDLDERFNNLYVGVYAILNDGTDFGVGYNGWNDGISPWDFDQPSDYYPEDITAYLYTDRSLYRPGQPVYFRGVLRDKNDMQYNLLDLKEVPVEVVDNRNQVIYSKKVPVTSYGTFSDSFDIAEAAPLGYYQIIVRPYGKSTDDDRKPSFSRGFNVANYRVPEYKIEVTPEQTDFLQGDKVKVTVESAFFFGGAVSNAKVEWFVYANSFYFNYKGQGRYDFYDYNEDDGFRGFGGEYQGRVSDGVGTTDSQGKFVIEFPADLGKAKQSQIFTVEANVRDESDQVISGRVNVTVHQGQFYIGASPEEYIGTAKKPQKVNLITVNWDSQPRPNIDLSIRVVERQWSSVQEVDPETGRTSWKYDVKETPVTDGVVKTGADGKATFEFTPDHGGIYKLYATSRDEKGNQITTSTFLWVAGPDYVPWRQQNSNRIDLKIDRDSYSVGDTASILIASPFQGEATALITVERGGVLRTEVITMATNSTVYKLPITPDMAPNAFVSVVLVKGVDATNPVAAFRMGLIQFDVGTKELKLNIDITPDKPQAGPRETVNYKIKVTDYKGAPVQAEVGVGITDLAVLSLLPDTSTPILQHFYSKAGLGVRTATTLTISVDQQTQEILNTVKGGGGGGDDGGIFTVRQRFVDTPLWKADVVTDTNGEATVSLTLPDNLTTWRLDARAVTMPMGPTATTLVGQNTFDLISTKPLLIRPVTPRFYVVGDKGTIAAVVNNNTDQDQDVTVRLEVKNANLTSQAELTGKIEKLGRQRFEWQIEIPDVPNIDVTFFASSADGKYTDAAKSAVGQGEEKLLPVLRYIAPETVGTGGVMDTAGGTRVEGIGLPRSVDVSRGKLAIRVDRSLAATALDALKAFENPITNSTEWIVSRFLPNLATYSAFVKAGLSDDALRDQVVANLSEAIQALYNLQKVDGGWGWIGSDESNPLTTAWVLIGLSEARAQGFEIDQDVIEGAIRFVQRYVASTNLGRQPATWQLNREAFMLYALARADAGNFSRTVRAFEVREKMSVYARALLAMAFNILNPTNTTYTDALLSDLNNSAVQSATGTHWEERTRDYINWNSDTRTTAMVLKAFIQIQPNNQLIPSAVRWLMVARKGDWWESNQETAWAVMALVDYMSATGELKPNYTFGVALNNTPLAADQPANPTNVRQAVKLTVEVKDLLKDGLNKLFFSRTSGDGMLYYTTHLTTYLPADEVKAASRGFSIDRQYILFGDKNRAPITSAAVGDVVTVSLTIVAPSDLHFVEIVDPIPAGAEAVDPQLATSGIGQAPTLRLDDPLRDGWGWWWFSKTEIRDDKVVLSATYLPRGTYRYVYNLRMGLAGEYKVMPATGQQVYFPEVYARSNGLLFSIKPGAGN